MTGTRTVKLTNDSVGVMYGTIVMTRFKASNRTRLPTFRIASVQYTKQRSSRSLPTTKEMHPSHAEESLVSAARLRADRTTSAAERTLQMTLWVASSGHTVPGAQGPDRAPMTWKWPRCFGQSLNVTNQIGIDECASNHSKQNSFRGLLFSQITDSKVHRPAHCPSDDFQKPSMTNHQA